MGDLAVQDRQDVVDHRGVLVGGWQVQLTGPVGGVGGHGPGGLAVEPHGRGGVEHAVGEGGGVAAAGAHAMGIREDTEVRANAPSKRMVASIEALSASRATVVTVRSRGRPRVRVMMSVSLCIASNGKVWSPSDTPGHRCAVRFHNVSCSSRP